MHVSSDSSKESVGTSTVRVILFGIIPTTIPDTTPSSDPFEDLSSDHIPPLLAISSFLSSTDDSSDILHVDILIPYGRPYRYHLNGSVHMMTVRKRVGPLPTHRFVVRHSVDYSSLDLFSLDDSSRDSSSSSSSETLSDSFADALFDSASSRSSMTIHLPCTINGANLEMDVDVKYDGIDIDLEIQADIDECIAYVDALRVKGIDARVIVEVVDREETETGHCLTPDLEHQGYMKELVNKLTEEISRNEGNGNGGNGNGENGNGGNGNEGNGNGGGNGYKLGGFMPARECTYQDFLKCQPLSFNGTEGVVGLARWFEKMETVFHISNYPEKYQVKYATCTLLNSTLTWWNSHKRTIRIEAAYAMSWTELMKLMTELFQELVLLCTRMVPSEEDKVERFVEGLPDNIQGNVIAVEPTKLQDAICIANNLMDQKLKGYARSVENKRRLENNPRDNRGQQPVFKRQNVGGHNMARAYTAGNNEKKRYVGSLPLLQQV
ncbi:hypothetical protein Tco_0189633 [Tanacetum coccineum]